MKKIDSDNMRLTPEKIEYEETVKKMRIVTARMRIAQEGVDTSSIPQQKMDSILRIFNEMEQIHRDVQQKKSKIQQDANISMQQVDQDANERYTNIQKKYQDIILSLKNIYPQEEQPKEVAVSDSRENLEEVREKTHDEKVSEMTEMLLNSMRDSVSKKIDEILRNVEQKAMGIGIDTAGLEENHTKQTTVESAMIGE
jgi:preprotein translocase subunit SecD